MKRNVKKINSDKKTSRKNYNEVKTEKVWYHEIRSLTPRKMRDKQKKSNNLHFQTHTQINKQSNDLYSIEHLELQFEVTMKQAIWKVSEDCLNKVAVNLKK